MLYIHTHTRTCIHTYICAYIHIHIRARTHTHAHTHTHTNTHTLMLTHKFITYAITNKCEPVDNIHHKILFDTVPDILQTFSVFIKEVTIA